MAPPPRNRSDHFLPRGYLRGFVNPARASQDKPLWCLNKQRNQWEQKSTRQICHRVGFYDFATDPVDVQHPDVTFQSMENGFPTVRNRLQDSGFVGWTAHLDFLLSYMQMVRARSPQFFADQGQALADARMATIKTVDHAAGKITHEGLRPLTTAETHDFTISYMREEIKRGAAWTASFHWQLRTTNDVHNPVVTSDSPLFVAGDGPLASSTVTMDVLARMTSMVYFPLCWQACLVGRVQPFDSDTQSFEQPDLTEFRHRIGAMAPEYVISPQVVPGLSFRATPAPKTQKRG